MWGTSWDYLEVNDPTFGIELFVEYFDSVPVEARIDHLQIKIHYTEPPTLLQGSDSVYLGTPDVSTQWEGSAGGDHFELINEGDPPTLTDFIYTTSDTSGTVVDDLNFDNTLNIFGGNITEITIRVFGNETDIDSTIELICGTSQGFSQLNMLSGQHWYDFIWPGLSSLALSQAELDGMRVIFTSEQPSSSGGPPTYENFDYVQFGDILDDSFGDEFVITAWIKPSSLAPNVSDNGVKNMFLSKEGTFELGINESGYLQVYLNDGTSTMAEYGSATKPNIQVGESTFIAVKYQYGEVTVLIGDDWYNKTIEPWSGSIATGGNFTVGCELTSYSCFAGEVDDVAVFNVSISDVEILNHKVGADFELECAVSKDDGFGGWESITTPGEIIDGYLNFECISTGATISTLEFYLSSELPDLQTPDVNDWSLIKSFTEDQGYYSFVINSSFLPDESEWYFIAKANDTYNLYGVPFGVQHFADSIEFYYDDVGGKINHNSHIGVVPLNGFESYIDTVDLFVEYLGTYDNLTSQPLNYSDIVANFDLIELDSLTGWVQDKLLLPGEYQISFNISLNLNYGSEFSTYNYNYSLSTITLDIEGPDISLLSNSPYTLVLGKTYYDSSEQILTAGIDFTCTDFDYVRLDYNYSVDGSWMTYNTFPNASSPVNVSFNILNLKDDLIHFRFVAYDELGNSKTLDLPNYWFVKDFDNHHDFILENIDSGYIYGLNPSDNVDLDVKVIPFDNDISNVVVSTTHETFNLTNVFVDGDHIYFSDEIFEDIQLDSSFYNIIPGEFTSIPIVISLYQNDIDFVTSRTITILATDTIFSEAVNITDVEIDHQTLPQTDNVWMSFETGTSSYKNDHEIPFIANNQFPVIKIFDNLGTLKDSIVLKANSDGTDNQNYLSVNVASDNTFRLAYPTLQIGENVSHISEIIINTISYNFSSFVDDQDIFVKILDEVEFVGPQDVDLNFEITTSLQATRQFVGNYDFQALPQGNYTVKG